MAEPRRRRAREAIGEAAVRALASARLAVEDRVSTNAGELARFLAREPYGSVSRGAGAARRAAVRANRARDEEVRLTSAQADVMESVLEAALDALGLTDEQREQARLTLAEALVGVVAE